MIIMLITVITIVLIDMVLLISINIILKDPMVKTNRIHNRYKIIKVVKIKACVKILMDHQETQNIL